jgi:putative restriction endonuclease
MRGYVGVTDLHWYRFLRDRQLTEANFWTPSGKVFKALEPGETFFFRLKAPISAVAGFGTYVTSHRMPDWLAWETFGAGNGCGSLKELSDRLGHYRRKNGIETHKADIGCIILNDVVMFPEGQWIPSPPDWEPNIVSGKGYDLTAGYGADLLHLCLAQHAQSRGHRPIEIPTYATPGLAPPEAPRFGTPFLAQQRLGQGAFRLLVTKVYDGACAVTGEHSLPVLDAAHIRPYSEGGSHTLPNGLLLRSDIHRLFDRGYVTVTPDYEFKVSSRLREDWDNGLHYYAMDGRQIALPTDKAIRPARESLEWHQEHVFLGG